MSCFARNVDAADGFVSYELLRIRTVKRCVNREQERLTAVSRMRTFTQHHDKALAIQAVRPAK
jgi:hypothetical protein